jgi:cytochrome b subunit of formate dehydrogenase
MAQTLPAQPQPKTDSGSKKTYVRFSLSQRWEHVVLLASFTTLAITGLVQKFFESPLSDWIIGALGGIENTRKIHHVAAIVLILVSIYHIIASLYRIMVLRHPIQMLPGLEDFQHFYQDLLYYFDRRKHKGYYGRYSYAEKVEYLAVVWGTLIMAITGFMMWDPIAITRFLPGVVIPAAKIAHGAEAILAVLAIVLWHFYHVHLKHFNKSMWTGKLTEEEMKEEHPAELAQIKANQAYQPPTPEQIIQRRKIFLPIASVLTLGLGAGLVWFTTSEKTAITTVPPVPKVTVFVQITSTPTPLPPATATPLPGQAGGLTSWTDGISQLINDRCGTCHVASNFGGLSMATYEGILKGGNSGPAVVPGDPQSSMLVSVQSKGDHPGQLSQSELEAIINWIKAGAPEQ